MQTNTEPFPTKKTAFMKIPFFFPTGFNVQTVLEKLDFVIEKHFVVQKHNVAYPVTVHMP